MTDCPICRCKLSKNRLAYVLNCGHSVCQSCTIGMQSGEAVDCPFCREKTKISFVTKNFLLNEIIENQENQGSVLQSNTIKELHSPHDVQIKRITDDFGVKAHEMGQRIRELTEENGKLKRDKNKLTTENAKLKEKSVEMEYALQDIGNRNQELATSLESAKTKLEKNNALVNRLKKDLENKKDNDAWLLELENEKSIAKKEIEKLRSETKNLKNILSQYKKKDEEMQNDLKKKDEIISIMGKNVDENSLALKNAKDRIKHLEMFRNEEAESPLKCQICSRTNDWKVFTACSSNGHKKSNPAESHNFNQRISSQINDAIDEFTEIINQFFAALEGQNLIVQRKEEESEDLDGNVAFTKDMIVRKLKVWTNIYDAIIMLRRLLKIVEK